jgi:hypothetical protein
LVRLIHTKDAVCVAWFDKVLEVANLMVTPEHGTESDAACIGIDFVGRPGVVVSGVTGEVPRHRGFCAVRPGEHELASSIVRCRGETGLSRRWGRGGSGPNVGSRDGSSGDVSSGIVVSRVVVSRLSRGRDGRGTIRAFHTALAGITLATKNSVVVEGNPSEMASCNMAKLRTGTERVDEGVNGSGSADEEAGKSEGGRGKDVG